MLSVATCKLATLPRTRLVHSLSSVQSAVKRGTQEFMVPCSGWDLSWPSSMEAPVEAPAPPGRIHPVPFDVINSSGLPFESAIETLELLNRNAREPKKANHGKRPCSHKNRRRRRRERFGKN